jgi:hypothetical protein
MVRHDMDKMEGILQEFQKGEELSLNPHYYLQGLTFIF